MAKCQITVLKRTFHEDLAKEYCRRETGICEAFEEGQTFLTEDPIQQPEDFPCGWAWSDINKVVLTLMQGGNFGSSWNWMKNDESLITCCTDGVRPVIFKVEVIER
ncbi:MAG: TIGR04076 family protein [Candidatus Thorarchaeota archaeon]